MNDQQQSRAEVTHSAHVFEFYRFMFAYDPDTGVLTKKKAPLLHGGFRDCNQIMQSNNGNGYLIARVNGHNRRVHRLAWEMHYSVDAPPIMDHINNDRADNRISNLREVGHAENQWNKSLNRNNSVGLKGAHYHKTSGKWASHIRCRGKRKRLGLFETAEEAHEVYCLAAVMLHGEYANLGERGRNDGIKQAA
ncbi:HNH endonuclease [Burkholderia pseudomallei]|uniref:HNH endonuclease n=1 Tax=Burkholderia pseudomallei TaxID=28450 RepID=UPI0015C33CAB|nr:HNH endonuclease [Burkholderia pseudomallei]